MWINFLGLQDGRSSGRKTHQRDGQF